MPVLHCALLLALSAKASTFDNTSWVTLRSRLNSSSLRHFPKGIDVYFENVGGNMLDEVLLHMNLYGRIAVSGMISQYNLKKPDGIHNLFCLITKRLRMEGFSELDFRHKVPEYLEFAIQLIREKKLLFVEDIAEGLENASSALVGIYHGLNVGKQIIQVSTD
ncbi:hypothetical protein HAX54_009164 [Datura stramonium]|uniref:Alcohol dehydrogenase-like C-terminal domain-containing protein n=1 Tax=Datura stramonium TaxID=4076 RepID=A0ABS8TF83_DATST|nr:hypothetical protein [Datura stramonium]